MSSAKSDGNPPLHMYALRGDDDYIPKFVQTIMTSPCHTSSGAAMILLRMDSIDTIHVYNMYIIMYTTTTVFHTIAMCMYVHICIQCTYLRTYRLYTYMYIMRINVPKLMRE